MVLCSLFAKVFKGKYYRNSDPLDPIRAYSPSYGWRSISSARSLVSKGLIKRVESGTSISVWNDPWIPATQPRSATCKFRVYPPFTVNNLIDQETRTWNIPLLEATIIPEDVAIIKHIPLSRVLKQDTYGWHYTKHGKYTVKSGFEIEQMVPVSGVASSTYGPHLKPLLAHTWKVRCPLKMKHFMWQALSGCVSVTKNLRSRGIQCDTQCTRCGAEEETINHVLFECPPAIQTWALSNVPSNPQIFPLSSVFSNFDYLFWRIPKGLVNNYFPWIIWYLWKNRNDNIFNNRDKKPDEILRIAEMEGKLWEEAQAIDTRNEEHSSLAQYPELVYDGWWCLIDGSWKESDIYSGQGWYCSKEGVVEKRMGSRNNRASLTPLHAEFEALIWAMECMQDLHHQHIIFGTDCSDLVKIVSSPEDWPAFTTHIEEFNIWKVYFTPFSIKLIPRARNTKADKLARSARTLTSEAFHAASVPPSWIKENF